MTIEPAVRTNRSSPTSRRAAFTLIELLMVISIMAVLGLLVTAMLRSAREDASQARTQSIILRCRAILQSKLEAMETRTLPFRLNDVIPGANQLQKQQLRRRIVTEWVMAEMPCYYENLTLFPSSMSRLQLENPVLGHANLAVAGHPEFWPTTWRDSFVATTWARTPAGVTVLRNFLRIQPTGPGVNDPWAAVPLSANNVDDTVPAAAAGYTYPLIGRRDLILNDPASTELERRATLIEGAECLYAILYNSWEGDRRGTHFLSNTEVGDLDGDGRPEVLDAFGEPLYFVIRRGNLADFDVTGDGQVDANDVLDVNESDPTNVDPTDNPLFDTLLNPHKAADLNSFIIDIRSTRSGEF